MRILLVEDEPDAARMLAKGLREEAYAVDGEQALEQVCFNDAGRLLAEHPYEEDLHIRLPDPGAIPADEVYRYTVAEETDADDHHRLAVRRVRIPPADTPYIILASQPLEAVEDELESLREILYFATPAALLLAGLGGCFFGSSRLRARRCYG